MESIAFAAYLFLITLSILCWVVTPAKETQDVKTTISISEIETSALEENATQKVAINESLIDSQAGEETTDDIPVVQEFQKKIINDEPIDEVKNDDSQILEIKEETSGIDLKNLRTYLLHKHRCIKLKDLPSNFQLPQDIKTYNLRGEKVVRLCALEALVTV